MKAKNLGLIVAGLMSLATAKGFSQEAVNTYTGADGTIYYYYNSGGEMGWERDGTLYLSGGQSGGSSSISGRGFEGYSLEEHINELTRRHYGYALDSRITTFSEESVNLLENALTRVLNYNTMDKRTTPEVTSEYMKGREMLLKTLTCYMIGYNIEPTTSPILNPETVRAYLNDDFFVNKDVFTTMPNLVIDVYEQIANMYYNKAKALPKDSPQQKAAYLECAKFAYEEPVARFGETGWLGAMTRSEMNYLSHMAISYSKIDNINKARMIHDVFSKFVK